MEIFGPNILPKSFFLGVFSSVTDSGRNHYRDRTTQRV